MESIITRMMVVPKGAGTARLKVKLEQTIEEEGLQKFTRVYTDGSVIEINMQPRKNIRLRNKRAYSTLKPNYKRSDKSHQKMRNSEKNCIITELSCQLGITGNDRADKAAKHALDQNVETTVKSDIAKK
jgi:hypothetical protein